MYASCSSPRRFFTVHTALGLPGSSETAISETASPWLSTRSVERADLPQMETSEGEPPASPRLPTALQSMIGQSESMSSTCSRLRSGRGSSSTTVSSPASKAALVQSGESSSSPTPWNW